MFSSYNIVIAFFTQMSIFSRKRFQSEDKEFKRDVYNYETVHKTKFHNINADFNFWYFPL